MKVLPKLEDGYVRDMAGADHNLMQRCSFLLEHGYQPIFTVDEDGYTLDNFQHMEMGHFLEYAVIKDWAKEMRVKLREE